MSDGAKKKRKAISINEKMRALQLLDEGLSLSEIATRFTVRESTIRKWRSSRHEFEKWRGGINSEEFADMGKMYKMRASLNDELDQQVFVWFSQTRELGLPLTGPMIQSKAMEIHKKLKANHSFSASSGWLQRWKNRHGVKQLPINGEKLSTENSEPRNEGVGRLSRIVENEGLIRDQIFHLKETTIRFKTLPKLLNNVQDSDHVTILICSNASGTLKIPLTIVGRLERPEALRNMNYKNLPLYYKSRRNAKVDKTLLKDWFNNIFVPKVGRYLTEKNLPLRALLLIENAPADSREETLSYSDVKSMILPQNLNPIQANHQGGLEDLKLRYRRRLMWSVIEAEERGKDVIQYLKSITIKNIIYWLAEAWEDVSAFCISESWHDLWSTSNLEEKIEACEVLEEEYESLISRVTERLRNTVEYCNCREEDVKEWLEDDSTPEYSSNANIVHYVLATDVVVKEEPATEESAVFTENRISINEAIHAANRLISFIESVDMAEAGFSRDDLLGLENIERRLRLLALTEGVKTEEVQIQ